MISKIYFIIKDFEILTCEYISFKEYMDELIAEIPDCPLVGGYHSNNMDRNSKESNVLSDWLMNLKINDWIPKSLIINNEEWW